MQIGDRFVLVRDVDRFPDFVAPAGLTGTLTVCDEHIWGMIDRPIAGAAHWDNQLYWSSREGFLADTRPCVTDNILDDLFHSCALWAWLEQARQEQGPPNEEATRRRAFRLYEEALREKYPSD